MKYKSGSLLSVFRVSMLPLRAERFFNIAAEVLEKRYEQSYLDSNILKSLKSSFEALYNLAGMDINIEKDKNEFKEETEMDKGKGIDFKTYWFENRIRNIRSRLNVTEPPCKLWSFLQDEDMIFLENPFLSIIYDYNKLNSRGQTIMKLGGLSNVTYYGTLAIDPRKLEDINIKLRATKDLITVLSYHADQGVCFIFWAMFVLTVDNTDFDKHLSEICDFAEIIGIQEDTILDIMDVINVIYRSEKSGAVKLRSEITKQVFSNVLGLFEV